MGAGSFVFSALPKPCLLSREKTAWGAPAPKWVLLCVMGT